MDNVERWRHVRMRTFKSAHILLNAHHSALDCMVRNLSEGGACLNVASMIGIPERFDVIFDADKSIRGGRMVWRRIRAGRATRRRALKSTQMWRN